LLRHRVARLLGRRPGYGEDISQIAGYAEARFGAVIGEPEMLKNVLLTVWKLAVPRQEVTGGPFLVVGAAALGVLLRDPAADLEAARPDLSAWWQANLEQFRAEGVLQDRSGLARRP